MSKTPPIDIRPDHWEIVRAILERHVPQYEVWAFGSRAKWTAKEFSDLDLAIITDKPLPLAVSAALSDDFSESDLPYKVDVVDWATVGEKFKRVIEAEKVIVFPDSKQEKLSQLLVTTKDGDWGKAEETPGHVPFRVIRGTDFENVRQGQIDSVPVRFLSKVTVERRTLRPGDILIETAGGTKDRPTGRTLLITKNILDHFDYPVTCASFSRFMRPDSGRVDSGYLYNYLRLLYTSGIMGIYQVQHTGVARFQYTNFATTQYIPLPPLPEQRAIAHILGTLDDKIECNRRMNETLEAMARAIFKDWFVDFGPVRAKAEGRQPEGMSAELAALFPDKLDNADKPVGWTYKPLDQIAEFLNGLALQKYSPLPGTEGLPVIKIAELRAGNTSSKSDRASGAIPSQYIINSGDILFAWSGSLLHDIWTGSRGALNQHLFKVTSQNYPRWFYYYWLDFHLPQFRIIAETKATTMGHIQRHHLSEAMVIVPDQLVLTCVDEIMDPLFSKLVKNRKENGTLAQLRDTLLPKLISGEMRVKDAEKFIGEAL